MMVLSLFSIEIAVNYGKVLRALVPRSAVGIIRQAPILGALVVYFLIITFKVFRTAGLGSNSHPVHFLLRGNFGIR
jgi:hypothetical protein